MCGICGFYKSSSDMNSELAINIVNNMAESIISRGPDAKGSWVDATEGIALGHRRLSIVDLSSNGSQPMHSLNGRYVTVFNGEIYNFKILRQELEKLGHTFRGNSDTEIMLNAIVEWGLENAVKRFIGMFAFALWDRKERTLQLVRDRLGEKPLYYGWLGDVFLFGSELKSLRIFPNFKSEVSRDALALYMRHNCIPAPYSIYDGIFKLMPGTILTINSRTREKCKFIEYWNAKEVVEVGANNLFEGDEQAAIVELEQILRDAVSRQMIADVQLGAFLSGGIDSSTIVALMQAQSRTPVKTFTIGFNEAAYNEAKLARAVASHLGTEHTELNVTPDQAIDVIPSIPIIYDEPFSDSSQIPTFLVAQLTRQKVTVSLSGDGGDELFGGYNRYLWVKKIWDKIGWLPQPLRKAFSGTLKTLPPTKWDKMFSSFATVFPKAFIQRTPGDKIHKLAGIIAKDNIESIYRGLVSHWEDPASIVIGGLEPLSALTDKKRWVNVDDFTQRMMYLDMVTYLPDDILVKVDRACMAVSLESRVPFLDHRVVEFAWKLPMSMKIRNGQGKWLLRQVLYKYVPQELIERPKAGFGVPIDSWLRGPLREWAENLLNQKRLETEGFFNPTPIRQKWNEHISGKRNWQHHLWDVLMFQAWLEVNRDGKRWIS